MLGTQPIVRHLPKSFVAAALIAGLMQIGACASGDGASRTAAALGQPVSAAETDDASFIAAAERSSAWGIHMSELEIANGARAEVKATAKTIRDREAANLALLARERVRLGLPAGVSDHHADPHMDLDEQRLSATKGEEADSLYLQHMLEQRGDIIAVARIFTPKLTSRSLVAFAQALPDERYKDLADLRRVEFAARPVPANSRAQLGIKTGPATTTTPPRR